MSGIKFLRVDLMIEDTKYEYNDTCQKKVASEWFSHSNNHTSVLSWGLYFFSAHGVTQSLKMAISETTNPIKDRDISPTRYVQNWSRSSQLSIRLSTGRNVSRNPLVYSGESELNIHVELSPPERDLEREREVWHNFLTSMYMVKGHSV